MKNNSNITSNEDDQMLITRAFDKLIQDYRNSNHRKRTEIIVKAFQLAKSAHAGAKRKSGEPYILHPIAVADIVCNEMGLGSTSISSALLHDVVEDTDYTIQDIEDMFGPTIGVIVDGLTKLSGEILAQTVLNKNASAQLENIRRLLLTANKDIRVILVKIADRLHNMRTLSSMPAAKQAKIAAETRLFYSPLAERLGMYDIKTELEDLSLKFDHPEEYKEVQKAIEDTRKNRDKLFLSFENIVKKDLDATGLNYEMHYRVKSVYSIWRKMKTKQLPFSEIYDIFAIRIIFDPASPDSEYNDCFRIYQALAVHFRFKDERIRDWISKPKPNGYRALHVTVMGPEGEWIEVQIRSRHMHEMAEKGLAAHWRYKAEAFKVDEVEEKILDNVKALLSNPGPDASDDYENMMYKFSTQEMLIFTPKGDQISLARGSTVLDFAYTIHTEIGNQCIGAKVNHEMVGADYILSNGDQVEVLTTSKTHPKEEWLAYATSPVARRNIQKYLNKTRDKKIKEGKEKLKEFVKSNNLSWKDIKKWDTPPLSGYNSMDDFYVDIARDIIPLNARLAGALSSHTTKAEGPHDPLRISTKVPSIDLAKKKETYILKAKDNFRNYIRPKCCRPIKDEDVHGILNENNQVVVHKRYCRVAINQKAAHGDRIINVQWGSHINSPFKITLSIDGINLDGFVHNLLTTLKNNHVELVAIQFKSYRERVLGSIQVRIKDVKQLDTILKTLKKDNDILRIIRVDDDPNFKLKV